MKSLQLTPVVLRAQDAARYIGVARSTFYELVSNDPDFPKKIRLSPGCTGYLTAELEEWVEKKRLATPQPVRNLPTGITDNH